MRRFLVATPFVAAWALALTTVAPSRATAADLSACGDFDFSQGLSCEVKFGGGCEVECTPLNVSATCEAKCEGGCNLDLDVDCNIDCKLGCEAECEVDPGKFDCEAGCNVDCGAKCEGKCSSSGNKTQCQGTCSATCKGECGAKCDVVLPSATCKAKCDAGCSGSCTAEANFDCRIDCEGGCQVEVAGGCEAQCSKPEGALFCNGQYVNAENVAECIQALASIEVEVSGSAECVDGTCTAEGSISCATTPLATERSSALAGIGAIVAGLAVATRRRRRS